MRTVNIHEAKTHLSRIIDEVAGGEEVVIARAGRPVAKLVPLEPARRKRQLGLLDGKFSIPEDFDTMASDEIAALFEGG